MVGTGFAGAAAAATMAELGYEVLNFCFQDSSKSSQYCCPRWYQCCKNYQNDGDSVFRLFYDTVKGGDFRSREANVHRLAEVSNQIIDQCVAQGVPFARDYGGLLLIVHLVVLRFLEPFTLVDKQANNFDWCLPVTNETRFKRVK